MTKWHSYGQPLALRQPGVGACLYELPRCACRMVLSSSRIVVAAVFTVVLVQRQGSKVPTAPVRLFIRQHKADGAAGGIERLLGCTQVSAAGSTSGTVRAVHAFVRSVSAQWHSVFLFGSCRAPPLTSSEITSFSSRSSAAEANVRRADTAYLHSSIY
jgi:hypothetical protein